MDSRIYHLDTSTIVTFLRGRSAKLQSRLSEVSALSLGVSQIVRAELWVGCLKSARPDFHRELVERFLGGLELVDFNRSAAEHYADIRAQLESQGKSIGPNDLLIAAAARSASATLITTNESEFQRVPDLIVENWS